MRDAHVAKQRDAIEPTGESQYLVYGHWFVLYAAKLILTQEAKPLPTGQEARKLVLEAIALVARACTSVKATAQYQLFRSSKTKARLISELEGRQMSLFDL